MLTTSYAYSNIHAPGAGWPYNLDQIAGVMGLCKECTQLPSFLYNAHGTSRKHKDSWEILLTSSSSCSFCALIVEAFDRACEASSWHSPQHMTGRSVIELETIGGKIRALCGHNSAQAFFSEDISYREENGPYCTRQAGGLALTWNQRPISAPGRIVTICPPDLMLQRHGFKNVYLYTSRVIPLSKTNSLRG